MKICYIARTKNIYFERWYEFFINRGHEVHVISGDDSHIDIEVDMPVRVKVHYVSEKKIFNQKVSLAYNLLRLPLILKEIKEILNQISPDIIHAHLITPSGFWAALSGFHPFIMTPAGSDVIILARKYLLYNLITRYVLKRADLITGDSLVLQEAIIECGGNLDKCHIIQNGVDLTQFHPGVDKNKIRNEYGLGKVPIILSTRGLTSKGITSIYNIDCIIKAIPKVLKAFPGTIFLFCYSQPDKVASLKELARKLGVMKSTKFIGYVKNEKMPFYNTTANINVSVPSSDSSPATVYEAMACGTPVIVSNLPWTKHFIKNRENALVVPPENPDALANAILGILQNNDLTNRLIKEGLFTVKKYVDYHRNMRMMEEFMENLIR